MTAGGKGYLRMPRRLWKDKYFHTRLAEDSGVADPGHDCVVRHMDHNICNNSEDNLAVMDRPDHVAVHEFGKRRR